MKYILKEIITNNMGIIDIPNGAIPIGKVKSYEVNSLIENICHKYSSIKCWVPIKAESK